MSREEEEDEKNKSIKNNDVPACKHSVYKLPRMADVEFSSYQSTYWLRFWDTEEGKSVKATYDAAEAFKDLVRIECKADQYDQVLHF